MKLVDADVAIDVLRNHAEAIEAFAGLLRSTAVIVGSEITRFEILSGLRVEEEEQTERFLSYLVFVPVTEAITRRAAAFAREHRARNRGIANEDYLVAATAAELRAELVTRNVRHFPMFPNLEPAY